MIHRFECSPISSNPLVSALVFDWDDVAGTVSGVSAEEVMRWASGGSVPAHPMPWAWQFSPEPLKSRTDLAAIIGYGHRLPAELEGDYPVCPDAEGSVQVLDDAGNVIEEYEMVN